MQRPSISQWSRRTRTNGSRACENPSVANPDRLSGLDASFLHLEDASAHMHIAAVEVFHGEAPSYEEVLAAVDARLHLVPRYRQRLAFVPLSQGRPVWVDDPHFNLRYHVRHTALPRPGGEDELRRLAGRIFSQALDRDRPLWELWMIEGLAGGRFALMSKTHHALVDGVSGVDIATVLFDSFPDSEPVGPPAHPWAARPLPSSAQLLGDALVERAVAPLGAARGLYTLIRGPRRLLAGVAHAIGSLEIIAETSFRPAAPESPLNVRIGPHRRVAWVRSDLRRFKLASRALDVTVNDVVLSVVAGSLRRYLERHGVLTDELVLRVMVPVSMRAEDEHGALGNRVSAVWVPLPVGETDIRRRLREISAATDAVKRSGQALSAHVLTELTGFAPTTIMSQAARVIAHQRLFNLVVTNVPGPQHPLYLLGRELETIYPMVPLAENTALGVAIISYNGQLCFGLTADFEVMADLDELAQDFHVELHELAELEPASPALSADP